MVACMATFGKRGSGIMLSKEFYLKLQQYVEKHLVTLDMIYEERFLKKTVSRALPYENIEPTEVEVFVENNKRPSFHELLFDYIDKTGLSDVEVYKKAGIDRRHFSKIRSNSNYHPSKNTAIALCLALKLPLDSTADMLKSAGYTLSDSELFDLVIKYCIERKVYDINDVNLALDYFSLKPLAGVSG
jgi:hypothetical protein